MLSSEKARPGSFWAPTWASNTVSNDAGGSREASAEAGFLIHSCSPRTLRVNCLAFPGLEIPLSAKPVPLTQGHRAVCGYRPFDCKWKGICDGPSLLAPGWHLLSLEPPGFSKILEDIAVSWKYLGGHG